MLKRTVLGFAAIAASTSCVPPSMRMAAPVAAVPVRDATEARSLLAFSLAIGNHFIAADHGARSRRDVLDLARRHLEAPAP